MSASSALEVTARGAAGDDHVVGVAAVLGDVGAHPRQRALAVEDLRGPGGTGGEAVVRGDAHPAARRELVHERQALLVLVADHPRAAVDLQQDGCARSRVGVLVHVEPVPASGVFVEVADAADALHAPPLEREREQHAPPLQAGRASASTSGSSASPQPAPSCSSSAAENVADVRRAAPMIVHSPNHDASVIARPSQPEPRVERAERHEQHGCHDLPGEVREPRARSSARPRRT